MNSFLVLRSLYILAGTVIAVIVHRAGQTQAEYYSHRNTHSPLHIWEADLATEQKSGVSIAIRVFRVPFGALYTFAISFFILLATSLVERYTKKL